MNNIQMIDINRLHPHPDNPRKDVGDVTELADSIKHSGVMQNLTVVPHEGDYRVIIGHRRLAAAKEAGLTELPCRVVEMTEREQVATMIAENMQRADLTVPEQVHGIQMMLNLGESLEDVQKKTGLSRSTVYHRKAMAALPADELQKSWERGGTIADYVALEQIKDLQVRTNLLKEIGTQNFDYKLSQAKSKQKLKEIVHDTLLLLEPVAKKLNDYNGSYWRYIPLGSNGTNDVKKAVAEIEADSETDYSFYLSTNNYGSGWLYIYRDAPEEDKQHKKEQTARVKAEEERRERVRALESLHDAFYDLRKAFITSFRETDTLTAKILQVFLSTGATYIDGGKVMRDIFGGTGEREAIEEAYFALCKATPGAVMLAGMEDSLDNVVGWWGVFDEPEDHEKAYLQLLRDLGYQMSDEERAYWTGTHELFLKEDEADV